MDKVFSPFKRDFECGHGLPHPIHFFKRYHFVRHPSCRRSPFSQLPKVARSLRQTILANLQGVNYQEIMTQAITRRQFTKRVVSSLSTSGMILGGFPFVSRIKGANSKLRLAAIGTGNRAGADIAGVAHEQLVALADVDTNFLAAAKAKFPGAKTYRDFRILLEKEAENIDGVVVGTPDHTHATIAAMAMRLGKHVYCEKPLTHTVHETRVLMKLAQKHRLVTQMGTQIHAGNNYRQVVELVQSGAIGDVNRVHVWVNVGSNYSDGSFDHKAPVPAHLDWDLWLGPAPKRPYSEGIHPFNWRKFWDYGTGRLGDFGCHYLDLVHWALKLKQPKRVHAQGPAFNPISPPPWLTVDYTYPRPNLPDAHVTWYGAQKPAIMKEYQNVDGSPIDWGSAQLFVGSSGAILSNYSQHLLFRKGKAVTEIERPEPSIPRSVGHHKEWTDAIRSGDATTCNFDYAGNLTQAVLLGSVSYRENTAIDWNASEGRITNQAQANRSLHKEYRAGWTL